MSLLDSQYRLLERVVLFNCLLLEQDMLELEQPDSLLLHGQVNTWRIQLFAQWRRRWPLWSDPYAYFSGTRALRHHVANIAPLVAGGILA